MFLMRNRNFKQLSLRRSIVIGLAQYRDVDQRSDDRDYGQIIWSEPSLFISYSNIYSFDLQNDQKYIEGSEQIFSLAVAMILSNRLQMKG